ncbi:MAG TPA: carboxypeptidase regulatory-like domain-containing protein, partial [Thermoanaerobaculia bacterium]|nr:carboxypeptidase regulatory-like domain-containing protein [Thermoanaerobaculia bacterium]
TPFVNMRFKKGTIRGRTVILDELGQKVGVTSLITYRTTTVNEGLVVLDWSSKTLETDGDGWFEIPDVLIGRYGLSVTNAFHGSKSVSSSLEFHGDVAEHEIVFEQNGSIRGTVLDVDGVTPVPGAVVHLRHSQFSEYDVVTDEEGRFAFELVPPDGRLAIDVDVDQGAIFRRTRVWVHYNEHGLDMDVDIELRPQGTVSGWVEDAGGALVPGAIVTLREHAYPRRTLTQTADGEGYYSFTNVFAGRLSIEAQAPQLGGVGGKTVVPLSTEGEEVWSLITLEGTGEVIGRVISPIDGQPVPSAQVTLYEYLGGVVDAVTADDEGAFRFRLLPLGVYRIWVFDPRTGRHGALDLVEIAANGEVAGGDVTLEVRGEVEGHVYDPDGDLPVPGGTVKLSTDSLVHLVTYASSDADGYFEFLGIPEGDFDLHVREPEGRRDAKGSGTISEEGERVSVDLRFQQVGSVSGTVWNPPGAPAGAFPNVNTVIRENGRVVGATLDNPYSFDGLVVGRGLRLESYEIGGNHRGVASGEIVDAEVSETIDVTMVPIGSVTVRVEDSFGAPVAGADLRLTSSGFYGRRFFTASTGGDGTATFNGVGEGSLAAFVTNPVNDLRGSATGSLALEGEQVEIDVTLENAGSIAGRLLLADGVTPAADALVVVAVGGRSYQLRAELDGTFSFPSLPLGNWTLYGAEYFGDAGSIEVAGTLVVNGEAIDLGDLVLDDADPEVLALSPGSGSRDLALSTAVVVDFSEPIDGDRFAGSWFTWRKISGSGVAYSVAWSNGGTRATLTPNAPLANYTGYELIVNQALDLAGRGLKERVKTTFFTVDQVAPTLIDVLPRNGDVQVPVGTSLHLTFSEPVVLASLSGSAIQLTDLDSGQGVTTTFLLLSNERQVIVTPVTALANDRTYQLQVSGVEDGSGNAMTPPVTTSFRTPDTTGPTFDSVTFPNGASWTAGDEVLVAAAVSDWSEVAEVFVRLGDWSFADDDGAAPWAVTARAPVVPTTGEVTVTVEAVDVYGNSGTTTSTLQVAPYANASPPVAEALCGEQGDPVLAGFEAILGGAANDDEEVEGLFVYVDGQEIGRSGPARGTQAGASFGWTPPAGALAGDSFAVRVEARDFAGNLGVHEFSVTVPSGGQVLTAGKPLSGADAGSTLYLAAGSYPVVGTAEAAELHVMNGARLLPQAVERAVVVDVDGRFKLYCGASVDAEGMGYPGGSLDPPGAPEGIPAAGYLSGGSHGGVGGGSAGPVFDSVYSPRHGGGGGGRRPQGSFFWHGSPGGGLVDLQATELVLEGDVLARGISCEGGGGAGGGVRAAGGTVISRGLIDASGAGTYPSGCDRWHDIGSGGGGRVALLATGLLEAHPDRVDVGGGWSKKAIHAATGTLLLRDGTAAAGRLVVDAGQAADGTPLGAVTTELPPLGSGVVTATEAVGADLRVTGAEPFLWRWEGSRMTLLDAAGGELGSFAVAAVEVDGRVLLTGA